MKISSPHLVAIMKQQDYLQMLVAVENLLESNTPRLKDGRDLANYSHATEDVASFYVGLDQVDKRKQLFNKLSSTLIKSGADPLTRCKCMEKGCRPRT